MDDAENIQWVSADGRHVAIKNLSTGHLVNILNWINSKENSYPKDFIASVENYATSIRVMTCFANNEPYPYKRDNGSWALMESNGNLVLEKPPEDYLKAVKKLAKAEPSNKALQRIANKKREGTEYPSAQ